MWYLWTHVRTTLGYNRGDELDPLTVKDLVPKKIQLAKSQSAKELRHSIAKYQPGWEAARGKSLPPSAPSFEEVAQTIEVAARDWTPWL